MRSGSTTTIRKKRHMNKQDSKIEWDEPPSSVKETRDPVRTISVVDTPY